VPAPAPTTRHGQHCPPAPAIRGHALPAGIARIPASLDTMTNNRHQFEQNQIHGVETGINSNKIDFLYADCRQILLVPISQNRKKISKENKQESDLHRKLLASCTICHSRDFWI
jgi:hypothetical protein